MEVAPRGLKHGLPRIILFCASSCGHEMEHVLETAVIPGDAERWTCRVGFAWRFAVILSTRAVISLHRGQSHAGDLMPESAERKRIARMTFCETRFMPTNSRER